MPRPTPLSVLEFTSTRPGERTGSPRPHAVPPFAQITVRLIGPASVPRVVISQRSSLERYSKQPAWPWSPCCSRFGPQATDPLSPVCLDLLQPRATLDPYKGDRFQEQFSSSEVRRNCASVFVFLISLCAGSDYEDWTYLKDFANKMQPRTSQTRLKQNFTSNWKAPSDSQ